MIIKQSHYDIWCSLSICAYRSNFLKIVYLPCYSTLGAIVSKLGYVSDFVTIIHIACRKETAVFSKKCTSLTVGLWNHIKETVDQSQHSYRAIF